MIYDFSFKKIDENEALSFVPEQDEECNLSDDLLSENSPRPDDVRDSIASRNMDKSILVKSKVKRLADVNQKLSSSQHAIVESGFSKMDFKLADIRIKSQNYTNPRLPIVTVNDSCTEDAVDGCRTPTRTQISALLRSLAETKELEKELVNETKKKRHSSTFKAKSLPYRKDKPLYCKQVTMNEVWPSEC